jgi:hypothetical protein
VIYDREGGKRENRKNFVFLPKKNSSDRFFQFERGSIVPFIFRAHRCCLLMYFRARKDDSEDMTLERKI